MATLGDPRAARPTAGHTAQMPLEGGLFGRDREQERLLDGLRAAQTGRGGFWLVCGDAGIGKTALCEWASEWAATGGMACAWGLCSPTTSSLPFWPWRQAMHRLGLPPPTAPDEEADETMQTRAERLERLLSDLEAGLDRPSLVVLEDVHWSDQGSRRLLEFLAPQLRQLPLMVVATTRDLADIGELSQLHRVVRGEHLVALGGLDEGATAALLEALGPDAARPAMTDVHGRTGGNPLFIRELVRYATSHESDSLPETVRAVGMGLLGVRAQCRLRARRPPPGIRRPRRAGPYHGRVADTRRHRSDRARPPSARRPPAQRREDGTLLRLPTGDRRPLGDMTSRLTSRQAAVPSIVRPFLPPWG